MHEDYTLVARKRDWVPEWLWQVFCLRLPFFGGLGAIQPFMLILTEKPKQESDKMNKCRESGDAFLVEYTVNQEGFETENITHLESIEDGVFEERGDTEIGWIADLDEGKIFIQITNESDIAFHHISLKTAEQLADMLDSIVSRAKKEGVK